MVCIVGCRVGTESAIAFLPRARDTRAAFSSRPLLFKTRLFDASCIQSLMAKFSQNVVTHRPAEAPDLGNMTDSGICRLQAHTRNRMMSPEGELSSITTHPAAVACEIITYRRL